MVVAFAAGVAFALAGTGSQFEVGNDKIVTVTSDGTARLEDISRETASDLTAVRHPVRGKIRLLVHDRKLYAFGETADELVKDDLDVASGK